MQYHISFTIQPEHRDESLAEFKEISGIRLIGQWNRVSGLGGFVLAAALDHEDLAKWVQEWPGLLTFEIEPVLYDFGFKDG